MEIRKLIQGKPIAGMGLGAVLLLVAGVILAKQLWPQKKADLSQSYFTDDDGASWYADSGHLVPPFDHNGKTAVFAQVFSYANGTKQFCAYMTRYSASAKRTLDAAIADARSRGLSPDTVSLFQDRSFMQSAIEVKKPGAGNQWINQSDPGAIDVISVHAPDGSVVDQVFVY
jgi:hypothetical protein